MHPRGLALLFLLVSSIAHAHPRGDCPEGRSHCRELTDDEVKTLVARVRAVEAALPAPDPKRFERAPADGKTVHGTIDEQLEKHRKWRESGLTHVRAHPFDRCLSHETGCHPLMVATSRTYQRKPSMDDDGASVQVTARVSPAPMVLCASRKREGVKVVEEQPEVLVLDRSRPGRGDISFIFGPRTCDFSKGGPRNRAPEKTLAPTGVVELSITGDEPEVRAMAGRLDRKAIQRLLLGN